MTLLQLAIFVCFSFSSGSVVFGKMETFLELPTLVKQSFYVLQEDVFQPGTIIAALENAVVSISADGVMTTISGSVSDGGCREGETPLFSAIQGIYQLNESSLIVSDHVNGCLRLVDKHTGSAETYAGKCGDESSTDGSLDEARFFSPTDIEKFGESGGIVVVEYIGNLRRVDLEKRMVDTIFESSLQLTHFLYISPNEFYITTKYKIIIVENRLAKDYTGDSAGFVDTNRTASRYLNLQGIVSISPDILVVADRDNERLRVVPRTGNVQSLCSGEFGYNDGNVTSCKLARPNSLMVMNGKLYIGEVGFHGGGIRTLPFTGMSS